jgi:hypothetical protein
MNTPFIQTPFAKMRRLITALELELQEQTPNIPACATYEREILLTMKEAINKAAEKACDVKAG